MYKKYLGPTLAQAVREATGVDPDEQLAIYHELALMREHTGQFVKMYSAAIESRTQALASGNTEAIAKAEGAVANAGEMMANALNVVTDVCVKATKIREKQKDRFSIHDLKYVIDKIQAIHYKMVGKEHPELVKAFAEAIEQELVLPSAGDRGTSLHPDDTARDFDSSVPFVRGSDLQEF